MNKSSNKTKRISVRLDQEASIKLEEAKAKGYTSTQFVNEKLKSSNIININSLRNIMISITKIQSELEFENDDKTRDTIREELNSICQSLKSFQSNT